MPSEPRPTSGACGPRLRAAARWLDIAERCWMGRTFPPPGAALVDEAWNIDENDTYCPRCGGSVGEGEVTAGGCARCRKMVLPYEGFARLGRYEGPLRDWLLSVKYHRWPEMADHLGRLLGETVRAHPSLSVVEAREALVVPIPMPWLRRVYRGIDHARVLADGVGRVLDAPVWSVLSKPAAPPQTGLSRSDRQLRRARGWISPRRSIRQVRGLDVILVDDIRTTGATLRIAARLLKRAGARRIIAAVVAVADEPGRGRTRIARSNDAS